MKKRLLARNFQALTGVILGMALVFWFLRPGAEGPDADPARYFLTDPLPAPAFTLTSQRGEAVSSSDFPNKLLVVFFGYTFCPDVCPLTLSNLSRAFAELGGKSDGIQVLFISVDPDRDTPERLGQYLGAFHTSFLGATGKEEDIRKVADGFGVFFARNGDGPEYTVDHTARTFVLDPSGMIRLTFPVTATSQEMARDLALLLERVE